MRTYLLTAALALPLALPAIAGSDQAEKEYVPEVESEALHKGLLPGTEDKEVMIVRFKAPPGFQGGRHMHPGPVYVYILSGALEVETQDGKQTLSAGDFVAEPVNEVMQSRNVSDAEPVELLVFQVGDMGRPMMVQVD